MARIVVLADTHMPRRGRELPGAVLRAAAQADALVHLGDFTRSEVLRGLRELAPLYAVCGNNDDSELQETLPDTLRFEVGGKRFVLLHGHLGGPTALQAARKVGGSDAVLFGHSHQSYCQTENGRLLFNPGSPTDGRWSGQRSFGIIDVEDDLQPRIVSLS